MARLKSFDDPDWMEVTAINNYAVFMGYLLIGVRGLSLLMVTWTTVVLLGGFVSVLQKKDFWALTFITLVQAAGVDFLLKEKLRDIGRWIWGLLAGLVGVFATPNPSENSLMLQWTALGLLVVQLLVFIIILCPLAILYVLGLYISAWISLRRLIEHDYGNTDESANLEPALVVLYSLGVAQGVLFGYRAFYGFRARKKIAKFVADHYNLGQDIVLDYLDETVRVCEKDPSLAKGRNLVTYAVDMMESKLCDTYINGVSILGTIIYSSRQEEKRVLAKQLLTGSPSSSFIIRKLLQTMGPRSPYSTEIKEHAAKIMLLVAGGIRLEQFPGGIQCIYSLLDPLDVYKWRPEGYERDSRLPEAYERDWLLEEYESSCYLIYKLRKQTDDNVPQETDSNYTVQGHRGLVVQGLCILQKLSVDEDNCRVICSTESLLSKFMVPLISDDELQMYHHDEWCSIVEESLELISRLMATPGETGDRMHHEISSNIKAVISTLESIVECHKCELLLKRQAVEILLDLSVDTSSIMTNGNSYTIFNWILLHILHFPDNIFGRMRGTTHWAKKSSYLRRLAGEKLSAMLSLQRCRIELLACGVLSSEQRGEQQYLLRTVDNGHGQIDLWFSTRTAPAEEAPSSFSLFDPADWPEVKNINNDAVFKGYLLIGVRGLGALVIAWNTAVLLGGFVPNLETKDFWCLTAISVIQAAGVVDFVLKEKFTDILSRIFDKFCGYLCGIIMGFRLCVVIKILRCLALLCLLAPVPVLGLYISTGISVYRLIEHNYGNTNESANLEPALYVLYSLAMAQGVLYGYKTINAIGARIKQANDVASCSLVDRQLVLDYLDYIVVGCKKDTSFASRRNLVTYAIDLMMECKSNDTFIVGIKVLGQVIKSDRSPRGRLVLAKHMLTGSASFWHLIQRLLETLGPRSPYNKEIREHAASIVALVAGDIHLEQFPRGIQCISSLLLDKSLESEPSRLLPKEYERFWLLDKCERDYLVFELQKADYSSGPENDPLLGYARLVIQGLRILRKLVVDEDNCGLIINTKGLLSKITNTFLISNQVHISYHYEWGNMIKESLDLMSLLMVDPWETETKLQIEISSNIRENSTENISTLEGILQCCRCSSLEKRKAIEFLLLFDPSVDMSRIMASGSSSRMLKWTLLAIFLLSDISHIRKLACKKLHFILSLQSYEGSATSTLQTVNELIDDLTGTLKHAGHHTDRLHAAQILEQLCFHYTKDDDYLKKLKQAVVNVMLQVLKEIFSYARREEEQAATEANNVQFSVPSTDLESGGVSQENGERQEGSKLREALISLCWVIWVKWYRLPYLDMIRQLDAIAQVYSEQGNYKPVQGFGELVIEARELLKPKKELATNTSQRFR
ncbi:hypothetical protein ACP70R_033511 [Stipagrostis hirtigluma subsp. patula]